MEGVWTYDLQVVLAVAQLYYHMAPKNEIGVIAKSLIRLLRNHREVQSVVLTNIATISAKRRVQYAISKVNNRRPIYVRISRNRSPQISSILSL